MGLSVALVASGLSIGAATWTARSKFRTEWTLVPAITCATLGAVALTNTAVAMFPYSAEYHRWSPESGVVAAVSSRLLGGDDSTTQRYVVQFNDGRERSCEDTRYALVEGGDVLDLSCKRSYQWSGSDGWDCNFEGREAAE